MIEKCPFEKRERERETPNEMEILLISDSQKERMALLCSRG